MDINENAKFLLWGSIPSLLVFFSLDTLKPANADSHFDCYRSFNNLVENRGIEYGNQSTTCGLLESRRQQLFSENQFEEKLNQLKSKSERVRSEIDKTHSQVASERAAETVSDWKLAFETVEAVNETLDSVNDCLRAMRNPTNPRKVIECVREVDEANGEVGEAIDAMDDAETKQVLRQTSGDLIKRYEELLAEWKKAAKKIEAKRDKFVEMCRIIEKSCIGLTVNQN